MIIGLRGTNGAGKSTIVRRVLSTYPQRREITVSGRRKPLGYVASSPGCRDLFVPGHYEIANGGVDTLSGLDEAYRLILEYGMLGMNVLYEGKNMSDGPDRTVHLKRLLPNVRSILVSYPLEDCVAAVRQRGHSIKVQTIERLYHKSFRDMETLNQYGVVTAILPRHEALEKVQEWLSEE